MSITKHIIEHEALDIIDKFQADQRYLKTNQSTPQTITGGKPIFNSGLVSNGDIIIKAGQKVVFDG